MSDTPRFDIGMIGDLNGMYVEHSDMVENMDRMHRIVQAMTLEHRRLRLVIKDSASKIRVLASLMSDPATDPTALQLISLATWLDQRPHIKQENER